MCEERARYAHPIVLDRYNEVFALRARGHCDATIRRCVFHGVVQEVVDGLRETDRITVKA